MPAQAGVGPGADRYIVVLKNAVDSNAGCQSSRAALRRKRRRTSGPSALHGYSGHRFPNDRVAALRADENVAYVEPTTGSRLQPHRRFRRASTRSTPTSAPRSAGNGSGAITNVDAYVIDTGIDTSHPDLNVVEFRQLRQRPATGLQRTRHACRRNDRREGRHRRRRWRRARYSPPRDQGAELRGERQLVRRHLRNQLRRRYDRTAGGREHEPRRPAEHGG